MTAKAWLGEAMGGRPALGQPTTPEDLLAELARSGAPIAAIDDMLQSPEQSDRLLRVARIVAEAIETFGSEEKAVTWLHRPTTLIGRQRPIELLDTNTGCGEVETALGRIAHGIGA